MGRLSRFKMFGGALSCPQGFICTDSTTILTVLLIIIVIFAGVVVYYKTNKITTIPKQPRPIIIMQNETIQQQKYQPDPRFSPMPPERDYSRMHPLGGFAVNTRSRDYPEQYQQVGVLTAQGGTDNSATPTRTILPLFGRCIDSGRSKWNYYTRTDGMNPVQVPVQFKRKNCDGEYGCDEISEGDNIAVPVMGQSYVATLYNYSTPRYLP
jgi:hypothetical protein